MFEISPFSEGEFAEVYFWKCLNELLKAIQQY